MSNWKFSRYAMYKDIHEYVGASTQSVENGDVLFVGENGDSSIIPMFPRRFSIEITDYPQVDISNLKYTDNSLDYIVADQVLEHVKNPWKSVEEVYRVLKPGGTLILTTCLMNPVHYASEQDENDNIMNDYWRFTPYGLRLLCDQFSSVERSTGSGSFKFLYNCMSGYRHKLVEPGSDLEPLAMENDNKHYMHVWIIAKK